MKFFPAKDTLVTIYIYYVYTYINHHGEINYLPRVRTSINHGYLRLVVGFGNDELWDEKNIPLLEHDVDGLPET